MQDALRANPPELVNCPACNAPLERRVDADGYGVARCGSTCGEMPVVANVILSSDRALQQRMLELLRTGQRDAARAIVLDKYAWRTKWMDRLGVKLTFRRFIRHGALSRVVEGLKLTKTLEKMPPRRITHKVAAASQWNSYIRHRFTAPWFQSPMALLGLLDNTDGYVLDAPCGMGHLAYMISKLVPQERIVCMDLLPPFVYCTLRFFVPRAAAAFAHDMGEPLPLADKTFALAYVFDSFQYIPNKPRLAQQLLRIVRDDGIVSILHSPNPARPTIYHAEAINPMDHYDLFPGCEVRVFPSKYLADSYLSGRPIDLTRRFSPSELNDAPGVDVVVAKHEGILRQIPNVRERLIDAASNVQLSEQYRMRHVGDEVVFEANFPDSIAHEYRAFDQILPQRFSIPATDVTRTNGQLDFTDTSRRELLRRHILVDLPQEY